MSIFAGYLFKDLFVGVGTDLWHASVGNITEEVYILEAEFLPAYVKMLPVWCSILSACIALIIYWSVPHSVYLGSFSKTSNFMRGVYTFFNAKWFFDVVYNHFIIRFFFIFCYKFTFKLLDRGYFEIVGPTGLVRFFSKFAHLIVKAQSGYLFNYLFFMSLSTIVSVFYFSSVISFDIVFDEVMLFIFLSLLAVLMVTFRDNMENIRSSMQEIRDRYNFLKKRVTDIFLAEYEGILTSIDQNRYFGLTRKDVERFIIELKKWW